MTIEQHMPPHPGEFIQQVYFEEHGIGSNELARKLKISAGMMSRIITGKSGVSSEMALKLSKVLGRSPESWLAMQDNYDLWLAKQSVNLDDYEPLLLTANS